MDAITGWVDSALVPVFVALCRLQCVLASVLSDFIMDASTGRVDGLAWFGVSLGAFWLINVLSDVITWQSQVGAAGCNVMLLQLVVASAEFHRLLVLISVLSDFIMDAITGWVDSALVPVLFASCRLQCVLASVLSDFTMTQLQVG
jgi:hypothetical protein